MFVVLNKFQSASEVLHKFLNRKKLVLDVSFCHVIYVFEIGEDSDGNIQVKRCWSRKWKASNTVLGNKKDHFGIILIFMSTF